MPIDKPDMAATLAERGARYGSWRTQAEIAQAIKEAYRSAPQWYALPAYMRETLDINANKMARCLNGDFMYLDNWHDNTNYSRLAEDCLAEDLAAGVEGPVIRDPAHLPFEDRLAAALHELEGLGFKKAEDHGTLGNGRGENPYQVLADYVPETEKVRNPDYFKDPVRAFFAARNQEIKA